MKSWFSRLLLLGILVAVCIWAWRTVFPNPERIIRRQLTVLAQAASFGPKDGPLALLINPDKIAGLCTPDVRVKVSGFGYSQTLSGRDDVRKAAAVVRTSFSSLSLKFPDLRVRLAPDQESAIVYATANGHAGEHDLQLIELRFTMRRVDGEWLIAEVDTDSTLQ